MMKLVKVCMAVGIIGGVATCIFAQRTIKKNALSGMEEEFNRKDEVEEDGDGT